MNHPEELRAQNRLPPLFQRGLYDTNIARAVVLVHDKHASTAKDEEARAALAHRALNTMRTNYRVTRGNPTVAYLQLNSLGAPTGPSTTSSSTSTLPITTTTPNPDSLSSAISSPSSLLPPALSASSIPIPRQLSLELHARWARHVARSRSLHPDSSPLHRRPHLSSNLLSSTLSTLFSANPPDYVTTTRNDLHHALNSASLATSASVSALRNAASDGIVASSASPSAALLASVTAVVASSSTTSGFSTPSNSSSSSISSTIPSPLLKATAHPNPPASPSSSSSPPIQLHFGHLLSTEDLRGIQSFVNDLVLQLIIPFIERRLAALDDRVQNNRKGLRNTVSYL